MKNGNGHSGRVHILAMRARNIKSIRLVELNEIGDVLEVRGDSGQGKTSVLDSIEAAFRDIDPSMIRKGEDSAEIELVLSEGKVNRLFHSDGKDTLIVTGKDGRNVIKPKDFLRTICDANVFRPIDWVRLSGGEASGRTERQRRQRDQLLAALPMKITDREVARAVADIGSEYIEELSAVNLDEIQFDAHALTVCAALEKAVYEYRKIENYKVTDAEGALKHTPAPSKAAPNMPAGSLELIERDKREAWVHAKAQLANSTAREQRVRELRVLVENGDANLPARADAEKEIQHWTRATAQHRAEIESLERQLALARVELTTAQTQLASAEQKIAHIEQHEARKTDLASAEKEIGGGAESIDLAALEEAINQAHADVENRRLQDAHDAAAKKYETAKARSERLDTLVALFRDGLPQKLINDAQLPVEGLSVDDKQIYVKGIPLHQLGTSEQLRVGVAIAAALNPRAGFVLVDAAESLGRADRLALAQIAKELDLQLILTYVDPDAEPRDGVVVMRKGEAVTV